MCELAKPDVPSLQRHTTNLARLRSGVSESLFASSRLEPAQPALIELQRAPTRPFALCKTSFGIELSADSGWAGSARKDCKMRAAFVHCSRERQRPLNDMQSRAHLGFELEAGHRFGRPGLRLLRHRLSERRSLHADLLCCVFELGEEAHRR